MSTAKGQRRKTARKPSEPLVIRIELKDGLGRPYWITADLIDRSESGISVSLMTLLKAGSSIFVRGKLGDDQTDIRLPVGVRWCEQKPNGMFRAGLEFLDESSRAAAPGAVFDPEVLDCYEVMQLSPNADFETVERVYRILAQRYHPDNTHSGNSELFLKVSEAYKILREPEQRAAYDSRYHATKKLQWKIFDRHVVYTGREAEKRKREGILGLLYAKALSDPENASINLHSFEELLGCPREHLQSALWYLKGKGYVQRFDNGRYSITVDGFDQAEQHASDPNSQPRLLPEAAKS